MLFNKKKTSGTSGLVFATAFSIHFENVKKIFLNFLSVLQFNETLSMILDDGVKIASKRNTTLGKILSPGYFLRTPNNKLWLSCMGFFPRLQSRCSVCRHGK